MVDGLIRCIDCGDTKEIRLEKTKEPDGNWLLYYRCKECGFQWDECEYLVKNGGK